jgi:hypothetical protein
MLHLFMNKGLTATGVIDKYSATYWAITAIALLSQALMVWLVFRLNRLHIGKSTLVAAVPAA